MRVNKDYYEKLWYIVPKYIYSFFISNLWFLILNLPLVCTLVALRTMSIDIVGLWLFFSLIPFGPAFTALLGTMYKLLRYEDINITKVFFESYKNSFLQSLFLWIIQMLCFVVLYYDIRYFIVIKKINFGVYIFYVIGIVLLIMSLYMFPIISRFNLK
jgi:uncharacterized membrane protein YesL